MIPPLRNLLAALFLLCAGLCNGVMDGLQFHFDRTPFSNAAYFDKQFWDPAISWKNKYKNNDHKQGEKFFASSTALVFTTDAWHLFKFLMLKCFALAVILFMPLSRRFGYTMAETWLYNAMSLIALHMCFQMGFKLSYV